MNFTVLQSGYQKLDINLENKIFWYLKLSENVNNKQHFPKQILSDGKKIKKMISDIENWPWKSDYGTLWWPIWKPVKVKSKKCFPRIDFRAKIYILLVDSCPQYSTTVVTLTFNNYRVILELQKDRYFETLQSKYWNTTKKNNCPVLDDSEGITLQSLGGVFIATLIGLVIAMITLAFEVYTI